MNKRTAAGMLPAVLALTLASPGTALSAESAPSIDFAGHLVAGPGAATLKISYTCDTSLSPANHLYAAVKQGARISPDATSSRLATSYYSTNWKSDLGPNALVCDGTRQTQTLVLKPEPGFQAPDQVLRSGTALVQLCLLDNITGPGEQDARLDLDYTMQAVTTGAR